MIGDTPYDIEAAKRTGLATIASDAAGGMTPNCRERSPFTTIRGTCCSAWINRRSIQTDSPNWGRWMDPAYCALNDRFRNVALARYLRTVNF